VAEYKDYDFCGWATRNDLKCADGKIIRHGAFAANEGQKVPLVWMHQHGNPDAVLGHAYLENRPEGVYTYGYCNNTKQGRDAKEYLMHGDISCLSIFANDLEQLGNQVLHGVIREVSLVLAGANPGAFIESTVQHGIPMEDGDTEAFVYTGDDLVINPKEEIEVMKEPETIMHAEETAAKEAESTGKKKTIGDVIDTMNEEQQAVLFSLVGVAREEGKNSNDDEEEDEVKHSLFETNAAKMQVIGIDNDDFKMLEGRAKAMGGSLKAAYDEAISEGTLIHSIDTTGMDVASGTSDYGINDPDFLFPDYKDINPVPEFISRDMDWVSDVLSSVHKTPFSRIRTMFADITEDEARAKGYIKGDQKKSEVFTLLKRTTDPQTIYKLQKFDRDDLIDMENGGFNKVAWVKSEMNVMLNEEKARAILIGDGREPDDPYKIKEQHVRPIINDVPLFNVKVPVNVVAADDEEAIAKKTIKAVLRARKNYKGSGNPTFYTTDDVLTEMLLIEDEIGHRIYKTEQELATALRVKKIVTVEPMAGTKVTVGAAEKNLVGVIVNLIDYNTGANQMGQRAFFEDFNLDFNKQEYLYEERFSGALIKPYSALTIYLDGDEES